MKKLILYVRQHMSVLFSGNNIAKNQCSCWRGSQVQLNQPPVILANNASRAACYSQLHSEASTILSQNFRIFLPELVPDNVTVQGNDFSPCPGHFNFLFFCFLWQFYFLSHDFINLKIQLTHKQTYKAPEGIHKWTRNKATTKATINTIAYCRIWTQCFLRESSQFKDWYMSSWNCMSSSHGLKKLPPNSYNWLQVFLNKAQYLIWSYIKQTGNLANVYNYQGKNTHKEQVRKRTKHTMSWATLLNANW